MTNGKVNSGKRHHHIHGGTLAKCALTLGFLVAPLQW